MYGAEFPFLVPMIAKASIFTVHHSERVLQSEIDVAADPKVICQHFA